MLLMEEEAGIRKMGPGTFYRAIAKKRNSSKWRHKAYSGWIDLERGWAKSPAPFRRMPPVGSSIDRFLE
jgi:hypothetical protein